MYDLFIYIYKVLEKYKMVKPEDRQKFWYYQKIFGKLTKSMRTHCKGSILLWFDSQAYTINYNINTHNLVYLINGSMGLLTTG